MDSFEADIGRRGGGRRGEDGKTEADERDKF
jgi:hypothetical protein